MVPAGLRGGLCALICAASLGAAQGPPSVGDVMRRVSAYVERYGEKASIVVATEHYTQEARSPAGRTMRRIVADFAIVKVEAPREWQGFRDVVEVDGTPVSDRDRLVRLLTDARNRYDEARRLSDESARFNIGAIHRNFNVPTTALFFFRPENLDRFKFAAKGVDRRGLWEIAFSETSRPTLIRTPSGESVPSAGTLWVNPDDGTVVRTQLEVSGFALKSARGTKGTARIDVTYAHVAQVGMWVPVSMDEDFEASRRDEWETISGRALYSNYRQFQTAGRVK